MSIKSNVMVCQMTKTTWDVMQFEKLESYVMMSWFTVAWQEFFITRTESGGGEKPCGVMTMSHHCHNVQCLVSTPVMSIVHCPVVIVSVIESSQGQDSAADYEERVRFKHTLPLGLWQLSSIVLSNVMSSILWCPINILSNETSCLSFSMVQTNRMSTIDKEHSAERDVDNN